MVKQDPDDLITALSKNLKGEKSPVLKFTFKRGGLWRKEFAKAHSRLAKKAIRQQLRTHCSTEEDTVWPLLVRFRENTPESKTRLNCLIKAGRGGNFIQSMLNVFRVNFFKKKNEEIQKDVKGQPMKANPDSKTSARKKLRLLRNRERRAKHKAIMKQKNLAKKLGNKKNKGLESK